MKAPSFRMIITAFIISLAAGLGLLAAVSTDPVEMLEAFVTQPFVNSLYLGNMLEQAALTLLCALGFSITFRSGLFNLGGEGQIATGALVGTVFALSFPSIPFPFGIIAGGCAAFAASALVGSLIGLLRQKVQISELISSFLLSLALVPIIDYLVGGPLRNTAADTLAMAKVGTAYALPLFLIPSRLSAGAIGSLAAALITWLVIRHSLFGYDTRLIASNPEFARSQGVPISKRIIGSFALGAGFHGLAGTTMVYGSWQTTYAGMAGGLGWSGISAALLSRAHPLGAVVASLLLAFLDTGTRAAMIHSTMNLETSGLMQGIFFLFLTVSSLRKQRA